LTGLIARNNVNFDNIYTKRHRFSRDEKRVMDYLFSMQDEGASIQKAAANLELKYQNVRHIFARLIKSGEIFRRNKKDKGTYCSTAWYLKFDPEPITERLHEELERDIFGDTPSPKVRSFLEEYAAGAKMGMTPDECLHFAKNRLLSEARKSGVTV